MGSITGELTHCVVLIIVVIFIVVVINKEKYTVNMYGYLVHGSVYLFPTAYRVLDGYLADGSLLDEAGDVDEPHPLYVPPHHPYL